MAINVTIKPSELLDLSPLGIVTSSLDGRIIWCNKFFSQQTGLNKDKIEGQLVASLPFETVDKLGFQVQQFDSSDHNAARYHYWQEHHHNSEKNPKDNSSSKDNPKNNSDSNHVDTDGDKTSCLIHYYVLDRNSVSRIAKLSRSKLPKRPNWVEFLDYEISRSRRYNNPLSILKLQLLTKNNPDKLSEEAVFQCVKDTLMDSLRWADMISHSKQGVFLMVLPETPSSSMTQLENKLADSILSQLAFLSSGYQGKVVFGHSHWRKHDDAQMLIAKARAQLVENLEKG